MKIDRGFTLLELLITVGILAALTTVAVFTLNPVEQLKKSRDSRRLADLSTIFTATDFYLQETPGASMGNCTSTFYVSVPSDNGEAPPSNLPSSWSYNRVSSTNLRKIDGTGWLPLNLASGTAGTALTTLPVDPTNRFDQNLYYGYGCKADGLSYTISAFMESRQFAHGGAQDKTSTDGGPDPGIYEVGSNIYLSPLRPVGSWSFNEGSGITAADSSGNGNTGSANGTTIVAGKIGNARNFLASTDKISTPITSILDTDTHTIAFWLDVTQTPPGAWGQIMAYRPTGTDRSPGIWLNPSSACIHWRYDPGNSGPTSCGGPSGESTFFIIGTWYHVVGVKSGATFTFYVNGAQVESGGVANPKTPGSAAVEMGQTAYNSGIFMIDEARIYNRALSADEVKAIYNATK